VEIVRGYQRLFGVHDIADVSESWKQLFVYKSQVDTGMRAICDAFGVERGGYSVSRILSSAAQVVKRHQGEVLASPGTSPRGKTGSPAGGFSLNDSFVSEPLDLGII
jgi:hypothetical protein